MKRIVGLAFSIALSLNPAMSFAQDLDDTLDAELDALSSGGMPEPAVKTAKPQSSKPAANKNQTAKNSKAAPSLDDALDDSLDEPLSDPFAEENKIQADASVKKNQKTAELEPLEASKEPPAKAAAKRVVKPAPVRSEPVVPLVEETPKYAGSLAPASDEPNSSFESRLAAIYEHSEPVSDEKWSGLLGAHAAESYSVQAGDTLWDLSQTLFADGFYWSKLWAENPEIQNPHQIAKGQAIRFIGGTESAPPELRVVKDEPDQLTVQTQAAFEKEDVIPALREARPEEIDSVEIKSATKFAGDAPNRILNQAPYYQEDIEGKITQADLEAGVVVEQSEIVPRPILPPPSQDRRKVLLDIPKSFAEYRPKRMSRTVTIQRRNRAAEKIAATIVPPYIALKNIPEGMGEVVEVDQAEVASLGQSVIIRGNEPLKIGARYYSATPRFKISSSKNGKIGEALEIGGVLRIEELVTEKDNYYRAVVIYGVNPIRRGSIVLAGEPPRIPVTTKGRRFVSELMIVGGAISDTRKFFGDGATVFLDTFGTNVQVGDVLSVQSRRGERRRTLVPDATSPIGLLKVFAVSGNVASAFVVLTTDEIYVGDRTGPAYPTVLPDLINRSPRITRASTE